MREAPLSLSITGIVAEVLVREGQQIEEDQTLLRLKAGRQKAEVAQAQTARDVTQAHLDELRREPRQQEVGFAREEVSAAAAQLRALKALRNQAEASLRRARASQAPETSVVRRAGAIVQRSTANQAAVRPRLEATLVEVKTAQAELSLLSAAPSAQQRAIAQLKVDLARNILWGAQSQRDSVGGAVDRMESRQSELDAADASVGSAHVAVSIAEAALEETEAGPRPDEIAPIQARVDAARTTVEATRAQVAVVEAQPGGTEAEVALAEAEARAARARLDGVSAEVAVTEQQLAAEEAQTEITQARVAQAQAQLGLLQARVPDEQIMVAEADVRAAEAALEHALVALDETELRAVFAGTIASLDMKAGEAVVATEPMVRLADPSVWQIETLDLAEMDVVNVGVGDSALVALDALPGLELQGEVLRIKPLGENQHGDMTYKVVVELQDTDERMRWNMSALVAVQPGDP